MRLAIVDDHKIVRDGIEWMLSGSGVDIVGSEESGEALLDLLDAEDVDVVLLDVRMPGMGGLAALDQVKATHPGVNVVMLSMHDQLPYVRKALASGASGYLLKQTGRDELLTALTIAAGDGVYLPRDLASRLDGGTHSTLSPRETEVLQAVADGMSNKQVARHLEISDATVKTHLREVFDKLEVTTRAEAVANGLRHGLIN